MLTTPHVAVGATIGALIPNPLIAIPLAVGSHVILDSIPHWQEIVYPYKPTRKTWIRVPIDLALSVGLVFWIISLYPSSTGLIWLSAIAANLLDVDSIFYVFTNFRKENSLIDKFMNWHESLQRETTALWAMIPQVITVLLCLLILKK